MRSDNLGDWVLVLAIVALGLVMLGSSLSRDLVAPVIGASMVVLVGGVGLVAHQLRKRRRARKPRRPPDVSWV